jgi:hypothetical protein
MPPSKKTTWTTTKKQLLTQEPKELLKLIGELYKLNNENKAFLHTRCAPDTANLKNFIGNIKEAMDPPLGRNMAVDFNHGRKIISLYKKASPNDLKGIAELMLCYIECANNFTLSYGDMWEQFYTNIETMYKKTVIIVKKMETAGLSMTKQKQRLHDVVTATSDIGWDYHDNLVDLYESAFGKHTG